MAKSDIPDAAIARNRAWISAVTESLGKQGDDALCRATMRDAGRRCAAQLLEKTVAVYGRIPESVDELIRAINQRRKEELNASNFWTREGDTARFRLDACGCDLVQAGLAVPNPVFCLCSAGMFESLFAPFHDGPVKTEILKAFGFGDDCCEFRVVFKPL